MPQVPSVQEEGKALKRFAEKKMKGPNKPTHVSSMFLCQVCARVRAERAMASGMSE